MWLGLFIVMGNSSLLIGCHSNDRVPPYFVSLVQVSFKLLIFIHLTLHGCFGGGHAYLNRDDSFHPIGKGERSGPCGSSGSYPVCPQDPRQLVYPLSFGLFQHFL